MGKTSSIFPRNIRTFDSLKSSTFRYYYFGMMGQWIAANMQGVTQSFLVYYLTDSAAILGTTALATALPQLILLHFGGALADRVQKKRLLQLSQLGECFSAVIILIVLTTGYLSKSHPGTWWILIMTSVFSGIFNGLAMPARQAMINELVNKELLMNAVSLSSVGQGLCTLIGPAIAGFLIAGVGYKVVYATMVGLYVIAIILTNLLPVTGIISSRGHTAIADIKEGLQYIRKGSNLAFYRSIQHVVLHSGSSSYPAYANLCGRHLESWCQRPGYFVKRERYWSIGSFTSLRLFASQK